jgi:glycerophosphoryl diester phosphodiesterase
MHRLLFCAAAVAACAGSADAAPFKTLTGAAPIVIAHRGASGYLPEHTLAAYELGIKLGAAYIEPDLQITRDGHLVAMHDVTLTRTTNVESLFAPRNGGYAVTEFTLAEIKSLTVEPFGPQASTAYPGFTPSVADPFKVPTFREVLDFLNASNAASGKNVGVYPEAKKPISPLQLQSVVSELKAAGFEDEADKVFIQSFSFQALRDLAGIQTDQGTDMLLVALGTPGFNGTDFTLRETGVETLTLADIAGIADGVGVSYTNSGFSADFVAAAHALGLQVHAYTLRPLDQQQSDDLVARMIAAGVDGFFTDYTDRALASVIAQTPAPVPLPAAGWLLIAGLGGLVALRRRAA